jgi:ring-1,2-phenylacetyl-CoA epoxidase subunit PaaD
MAKLALTADKIWQVLGEVKDPEIPVVSVVEMGMIRSVGLEGEAVTVTMSPTFIGCPAIQVMQQEIEARLRQAGAARVEVKTTFSPPWSSAWITPAARDKLKDFGLAPPPQHAGRIDLDLLETARCPFCDSEDTELKNSFGPTLCRALYYCRSCNQPFEQFKPL